eukprot:scaffold31942_cov40-Cyclotella_meneghiniana.AAC.1
MARGLQALLKLVGRMDLLQLISWLICKVGELHGLDALQLCELFDRPPSIIASIAKMPPPLLPSLALPGFDYESSSSFWLIFRAQVSSLLAITILGSLFSVSLDFSKALCQSK